MKRQYEYFKRLIVGLLMCGNFSCGQQTLTLPESNGGACGAGYPASEDTEEFLDITKGERIPCFLFESVLLDGENTYLYLPEIYLEAKHGLTDNESLVVVIGASNCPACERLMTDLSGKADAFDNAGALMLAAIYCDNYDRTQCDFDLERSALVAQSEGWPTERWRVTNDDEGHLKEAFRASFPVAIVVRLSDMQVLDVLKTPDVDELFRLVDTLN